MTRLQDDATDRAAPSERVIIPPTGNETISRLKDLVAASVIVVPELAVRKTQ